MGEHTLLGMQNDARTAMVMVINASGIIQMVSKPVMALLGYTRGELDGKNISVIMPQPFSGKHNTFLKNYLTTGKPKILDKVREVCYSIMPYSHVTVYVQWQPLALPAISALVWY